MIKAYSVRYEDEVKKTIDTHLRIDKEIEMKRTVAMQQLPKQEQNQEGFVEGLKAVVVEALPDIEEINEKTAKITEDAKAEAGHIIEQAKRDAEQIKNNAYTAAQKKGYEDGSAKAMQETERLKADYENKARRLREEYDTMAEQLEPQMVRIIAELVEKVTGIVVEGKDEVLLFLINRAIKNMDKSDEYIIRVSKEDFEYVSMRKNLLLGAIGREVPIYITEDPFLNKNQCLIETDQKVINCSLDIQLNNLITDLKLIGGI